MFGCYRATIERCAIQIEDVIVTGHEDFQGGYRLLSMRSKTIAPEVQPGQFVHIKIPNLEAALLRRPFSVYQAEGDHLAVLYKSIGKGTRAMTRLETGEVVSLVGPLGNPFPRCGDDRFPVLVAGGYGMAALLLVAKNQPAPGVAFFGGATARDILCLSEFETIGWEVRVATVSGELGSRGFVTEPLDAWLAGEGAERKPEFFACGPNPMLKAVSDRAQAAGHTAWISMDRNMGCGVGACLTCVQKVRDGEGWTWARVCREGPVFECREVIWDD